MPEFETEVTFDVGEDQAKFRTQSNGDTLLIEGLNLTQKQAASLAWIVNIKDPKKIQIQIKVLP